MSVEARFYIAETTRTAYASTGTGSTKSVGGTVLLRAVSRGDQNRQWSSATPSGEIKMTVNNPAGFKWFEDRTGDDIQILFNEVDLKLPGDGHAFRPSIQEPGQSYPPASNCGECGFGEDQHKAA